MKSKIIFLSVVLFICFSCRKEETEFIQTPEEEILEANSNIAELIRRTSSNDGSLDNIVDKANCFDIAFPYVVNVNGLLITVNSQEDYAVIECVLDQSDSDTDTLNINFPITIILSDFSEISIDSITQLDSYTNNCNGENEEDNDIECIDFEYPIEASTFNPNNETIETLFLENDHQLFDFVRNIDESNIITMDFPLMVTHADSSEANINNFIELETAIENAIHTCDEDDDYDFSDDDCIDCTIAEIQDLLTNCEDWNVNRLKRNATDYDNVYDGYDFNFFSNGTMDVYWNGNNASGTWIASGSGNNLEIIINVPTLPLCNANWILQEIKNCSDETEINFIVGDDDRIQYINDCD